MASNQYILYLVGFILLLHSGYSSFEFHKFQSHSTSNLKISNLPLDISIEAIIGFIIIIIGSIKSIENQAYLSINNEIVNDEFKYLKSINLSDSFQIGEKIGITEFEELDSRLPFINIGKIRKEYSDWINEQEKGGKIE
ncbi:uncharacterized protein KGF55_000153 [Candida pseudojiufengensis]|uniref:uncharacterized protein n=1 Tax=Candida pseudojiufengensis TaxID=497109 RepID=UPI0022250129|nr:uncharacterized protein KGF55_000153 [Candida pseudojiufengensis]KAI5966744.1 hypothetical protein KGF55_000153 [Candida pseudojiufengensis]